MAYGSRTRRVLRFGIGMSSSAVLSGMALSLARRALLEYADDWTDGAAECWGVVDAWLPWTSGSRNWASTALPPTAPVMWSESPVVRKGATAFGIRGLPELLGGPRRMKSIRSELLSL